MMGGNAFKTLNLRRIKREEVTSTLAHIVDTLSYPGLTHSYINNSLMGSVGKKLDSGDIDVCMNTYKPQFFGDFDEYQFDKYDFLNHLLDTIPGTIGKKDGKINPRINSQTLKMGNLMTAWPICGKEENGLIQVDFIFGHAELLKFTHYSPSSEESQFKGVFRSQSLGIIAKMNKDFESTDPITNERTGRVGLHLSLEHGLYRQWEARRRPGMGCSKCTADEFETRFECERFPRIGYVYSPQAILDILFDNSVTVDDVDTFEKIVDWMRINKPNRYGEFWERFCNSAGGSSISKQNNYSVFDTVINPVWKAKEWQLNLK